MNNIENIIKKLKEAAIKGQHEIEDGDFCRCQLPDHVFTDIVSSEKENEVIEEMVLSGEWWRHSDGFSLINI